MAMWKNAVDVTGGKVGQTQKRWLVIEMFSHKLTLHVAPQLQFLSCLISLQQYRLFNFVFITFLLWDNSILSKIHYRSSNLLYVSILKQVLRQKHGSVPFRTFGELWQTAIRTKQSTRPNEAQLSKVIEIKYSEE